MTAPVWESDGLRFRYRGAARHAIENVTLAIPPGTCTAILGPNGSGKSTLLRLLLGVLIPEAGEARFEGQPLRSWQRDEIARRVGVVPQAEEEVFPLTVREMVGMGRYPHLGPWRREGADDRRAIEEAMRLCDVLQFADRPLATLSGGERQRTRVARALAQEPSALALDEPTAALDVYHEMEIFELLRGMTAAGVTVLLVTHHLNLAARYASHLVILDEGQIVADGVPADVLTRELVERVWRWPVRIHPHPGPGPDTGAPQVTPLAAHIEGQTMPFIANGAV